MDLLQTREIWWDYLQKIRDGLYCFFFLFMPFTQALTFNIGFPLKFSELALLVLGVLYLVLARRVRVPMPLIVVVSLLFIIVTISVIVNLYVDYPYPLREFETRFGYKGDSISRYVYFILSLLAFFISIDMFRQNARRYLTFWMYGALVAAAYGWYLSVFSFLRLPVFLLPGHPATGPQTIPAFGRDIIRCGTFLEGNFMALYLILSASLCFYIQKFKTGLFLLATVLTTFSTLGIVSAFLFLLFLFQRKIFQRKYLVWFLPSVAALSFALYLFSGTVLYQHYVYEKLFAKTEKVDKISAYSKADRLFSIKDAYGMGLGNPVLGVGLANYARHYDHYMDNSNFDRAFVKKLIRKDFRVIPNNVFAEVWAESGGIALLLFLLLLCLLLYYASSDPTKAILPGLVAMILCFNAYPSFIMIYFWCFMALPVADYSLRTAPKSIIR